MLGIGIGYCYGIHAMQTTDDATEEDDSYLPSPDDLGVDMTERE